MDHPQVLHRLAALPDVAVAVQAARTACTELRWHPALRRQGSPARAEATARAARASAAAEGAELPVDLVRDMLRGARDLPPDGVGRTVAGAVRATVEAHALGAVVQTAPAQALARLHTAAAAGLVPDAVLGRPRGPLDLDLDEPGPVSSLSGPSLSGPSLSGPALAERLAGLAGVLGAPGDVPALVVAALAHGEVMTLRLFRGSNGVVARALMRAVVVQRGLDPTGVAVPEAALLARGLPTYATALTGYASGTAGGMVAWLGYCATVVAEGAVHGRQVADAVLAGRLAG